MFRIYIHDGNTALPESGTYYVVARNGLYLVKDTGLVQATVKVEGISPLLELPTFAKLKMPKIPSTVIARILLFFRRIYEKLNSEAIVLLYFSLSENKYKMLVPVQTVTHISINYDVPLKVKDDYRLIGTVHSHVDFGAFHSSVDRNDEKQFDGIHITIGRVDQPYFTIKCSIVINNNRFVMNPLESVNGIIEVDHTPKKSFASRYKRKEVPRASQFDNISFSDDYLELILDDLNKNQFSVNKEQFYDLVLPNSKDYRHFPVPEEWIEKVTEK